MAPYDIGSIIKGMRKSAGLSQMALADKVGISYQQIQKYEKGTSKLNIPRIIQLARIFKVPVTAFLPKSALGEKHKEYVVTDTEASLLKQFRKMRKTQQGTLVDFMKSMTRQQSGPKPQTS